MKRKLTIALLGLCVQSVTAATITIQNSTNDTIRVWLYDENNTLINTWLVDNEQPKTVNSHLHAIGTIAWASEKRVPQDALETVGHLSRNSASGIPYSVPVHMKSLAVGHKFFILKDGGYKYQPGITKKNDMISGKAHKISELENNESSL